MKSFIVFLGLLLMAGMFFCYSADYQQYMMEQMSLKAAAEECAAYASLAVNADEYSKGSLTLDRGKAAGYAWEHFRQYLEDVCCCEVLEARMDIIICDDSGSYGARRNIAMLSAGDTAESTVSDWQESHESEVSAAAPHITVSLTLKTEDLIGLSFAEITRLGRTATYELTQNGGASALTNQHI